MSNNPVHPGTPHTHTHALLKYYVLILADSLTSQLFDQYIHYSHSGTASGSLVRSRPLFSCPLLKLSQVILCWRFRLNKKSLHCAKERIQCHGLRIVIQFHSARSEQCVPPDSFSGATEDGVEHGGSTHESLSARTEDRLRRC